MIPFLFALALSGPAAAGDFRTVDEVLARFEKEPDVRQVQEMVLEYSKTDPRYVNEWMSASRNAAWLPEVTVGYDYDNGYGYDYAYDVDTEGQLDGSDVDNDHGVSLRAKWRFDRLVMSSDRIRVISETQDIVKLRDKVLEEVTRLYFDRRRLQVDVLLSGGGDLKTQIKNEMRLQELTAQIDAYTGGRFSAGVNQK
ncbi:MAG: hypothetical protein Q8P41_00455 [Pseudomonadota bacterium]|nr:hypothetical protein [Pseudomonadota bacterium]